jgi:tetratricopeptide (TPR) repeat protein
VFLKRLKKDKAIGRRAKANLTFLYGDKSNQIRDKIKSEEDIEEAVEFSRMLIKDGYHDQAFQVLLKAISISPEHAQVNYWIGTIYNAKGRYDKAIEFVKKSITYDPDNIQLLSSLARIQAKAGDLDSAEKNYRKVLRSKLPDQVRADNEKLLGFVIGQKLILQNRLEDALEHYLDLLENFPGEAAILARIATVHLKLENYDTAEDLMKKVVTIHPVSPASHMQLAEIYRLKGKDEAYKEQLKKVLLIDPTGLGSKILNRLGLADGYKYLKEQNWKKANEAFDQALRFSPNSHSALLGKAKALSAQKLNKEAKELLNIIVEEDPSHYKARLELAKLYVEERDYDRATIELERIIFTAKFSREGQEALVNLKKIYRKFGMDLQKAGKLASAVDFFKRIVSQDPTDISAHLSLGRIYQQFREKWDLAVEHYLKVVELDEYNEVAFMNLGVVYENQKKHIDAMTAFANAVAFSESADQKLITTLVNGVRIQTVRIEYEAKNYDWAIQELVEISKADPTNVQFYLFLATIYTVVDNLELAIAALNEGVVNDPKNNVVRFRLADLYERTSEYELALAHYRAILRSDATGPIFETALDRVPILDQLVRTFNYSMQYLVSKGHSTYDDIGQSSGYFNSTLQFNLSARVRPTKALNFSVTASPTYTSLHDTQNDSWSPSYTFNQNYNAKNGYFNTAASYHRSEGLLLEQFRGSTYSLYGAMGYRLKLPRFLDANDARLPKTFEVSGNILNTKTNQDLDFSFTDAYNGSGKFTFISPITTGGAWIFNYGYAINYPKTTEGRDYLYGAHQAGIIFNKVLARRITGVISLNGEYRQYLNVDSRHAFETGLHVKRRYAHASINLRLEFKAHTNLNVFGDVTAFEARSNLSTGYIHNNQGTPIGIQSAGLGDNRNYSANLGMRYIF